LQQQVQDALATTDALHSEKRELRGRLAEGDEEIQRLEATVSFCMRPKLANPV
jgi:hypothetical protein